MDRIQARHAVQESNSRFQARMNAYALAARRAVRDEALLAKTQFEKNEAIKREKEAQLTVALRIGKLYSKGKAKQQIEKD